MKRTELQFKHGLLVESKRELRGKNNEDINKSSRIISSALSIGGSIVLPITGGALLGVYLDKTFHTAPLLTIIFIIVGVVSAFYSIIRLMRDIS